MSTEGNSDTDRGRTRSRGRGSSRWRLLALGALLTLGCMGCYRAAYRTGKPPNGQVQTQWNHFFFWGLAETARVDVTAVCQHGMSELIIRKTVANWFLGFVTLGIYSPLTATIHCAAETAPPAPPPAPFTGPPGAAGGTP